MASDQGMNPEDFGLGTEGGSTSESPTAGSPFEGVEELKDTGEKAGASGDVGRLSKIDFTKLKMILDVPLKVSVELGRTKMLVNDLLQLGQGSVIELDKIAGEPMEILINDKLVALGEVVVVNEKFGVRLTDVVSQFGINDIAMKTQDAA